MKTRTLIRLSLYGAAAFALAGCPEVCDDGKDNDRDDLTDCQDDDCSLEDVCNVCGDDFVGAKEECDDGNLSDGDGCSSSCIEEFCGDGTTQAGLGEACDDGNNIDGDGCTANCLAEFCGDGVVNNNALEDCDDGNNIDGDGCNANCGDEFCGDSVLNNGGSALLSVRFDYVATTCYGAPAEQLQFTSKGISLFSPPIDATCLCQQSVASFEVTEPTFLDTISLTGNTIDVSFDDTNSALGWATATLNFADGSAKNVVITDVGGGDDALRHYANLCVTQFAWGPFSATSAAFSKSAEECDDGNITPSDGCSSECRVEFCGDGIVQGGEECDDGNINNGDGCDLSCHSEILYFYGIAQNLPVSDLQGWTLCYLDSYSTNGVPIAGILANCTGEELLLACRETGSQTLTLAAMAPKADVTFDTGTGDTPHNANGVGWYYNGDVSWGFAPEGAAIDRNTCDVIDSVSYPQAGGQGELRMCWHTGDDMLEYGWRCGKPDFLGGTYERLIFTTTR